MKTGQGWGIATLVVGLLFPPPVLGQFISTVREPQRDTSSISVSGIGEVLVAPDRAVVFVELATEDATGAAAALSNGTVRSSVIERLASLGLGPAQVSLWGYGAGAATNRGRVPPPGPGGGEPSFEAKSGIRVVVEPVSRLDEVVSAVLLAGASAIPMVQLEGGESDEARREASRIAVSKAQLAAESIADAAGGRLGDLINLIVVPDYNDVIATSRFFQGGFMGQGVQLFPSDATVRVQVQATWFFEKR